MPLPLALAAEPLLTRSEVTVLARQIEAGVLARAARLEGSPVPATEEELRAVEQQGEQAWRRFVGANLRLVAMVSAQTAARTGLPEADLFQEGCLGLMTAVQRYDHARGFTFATYALAWIRSAVGAAGASQLGALNLPTSRAEQLRAARGVESSMAQTLGRAPTTAEVALALGRDERWTAALLAHRRPESLDALEALDGLGHDPPAGSGEAVREVGDLLALLAGPHRQVIELRFGFTGAGPCSRVATARKLSVSVGQVRRLEQQAFAALRAASGWAGDS